MERKNIQGKKSREYHQLRGRLWDLLSRIPWLWEEYLRARKLYSWNRWLPHPLLSFWWDKIPSAAKCAERRDCLMKHHNDTVSKNADEHTMTLIGNWALNYGQMDIVDVFIRGEWKYTISYMGRSCQFSPFNLLIMWWHLSIQINIGIYCVCSVVSGLFVTLWTVACQAPLSMRFFRQEYWSGLPFPPPGDLPKPGIKLTSPASPALAGRFFTTRQIISYLGIPWFSPCLYYCQWCLFVMNDFMNNLGHMIMILMTQITTMVWSLTLSSTS